MKMILKILAAAAILAALTSGQAEAMNLPAPIPEFRSPQELQAEAASQAAAPKQSTAERAQIGTFYTGKPQDRESGTHIFLFRNYDPELSRWISVDPSGYPDGPNNSRYSPSPTMEIDLQGLHKSAVWLYAFCAVPAIDNPSYNSMQAGFQNTYQSYVQLDSQSAGGSNPTQILDDGDTFGFGSLTDFSQLSSFTSYYDKIYFVAHGINYGTSQNPVYQGDFRIGNGTFTQTAIEQALGSALGSFQGCGFVMNDGSSAGTITTGSVISSFFYDTRSYLAE